MQSLTDDPQTPSRCALSSVRAVTSSCLNGQRATSMWSRRTHCRGSRTSATTNPRTRRRAGQLLCPMGPARPHWNPTTQWHGHLGRHITQRRRLRLHADMVSAWGQKGYLRGSVRSLLDDDYCRGVQTCQRRTAHGGRSRLGPQAGNRVAAPGHSGSACCGLGTVGQMANASCGGLGHPGHRVHCSWGT
jgi:hypothetical protein